MGPVLTLLHSRTRDVPWARIPVFLAYLVFGVSLPLLFLAISVSMVPIARSHESRFIVLLTAVIFWSFPIYHYFFLLWKKQSKDNDYK